MTTNSLDQTKPAEPWMRGTHPELDALRRAVVHALELSLEDAGKWAANLSEVAFEARPFGLPSVAFHLRHIVRSVDRLLTYAEDRQLSEAQLALLQTEHEAVKSTDTLQQFRHGMVSALERVVRIDVRTLEEPRGIGRMRLPTTVGGLLVHCAEHTQRHSGQMVTTAKVAASQASL